MSSATLSPAETAPQAPPRKTAHISFSYLADDADLSVATTDTDGVRLTVYPPDYKSTCLDVTMTPAKARELRDALNALDLS